MKNSDEMQLQLHRARMGLISFKKMAAEILNKQSMSHEEFLILNEAALKSDDYQDSITLNNMTIAFGVRSFH